MIFEILQIVAVSCESNLKKKNSNSIVLIFLALIIMLYLTFYVPNQCKYL